LAKKFLIAIAAIVVVMVALIALPGASQPAAAGIDISYERQRMSRSGSEHVATNNEILHISKDGSATYSSSDPRTSSFPAEKQFSLNSEEMGSLRGLLLETGFMEIPQGDYLQVRDGAGDYTQYTLTVKTNTATKTFTWVDSDVSRVTVPAIITKVGFQLDGLIQSKTT
jgi:hypothetical protein